MPEINTEKVCYVIAKARELEAEEEGAQPDSSNPSDDKFLSVLTEEAYSPLRRELSEFIGAMDEDEQAELVALCWVGRSDYGADDWEAAVALARDRRRQGPTARYLLGLPLLASYLEAGLDEFDESCEGFEDDRQ
jgi:hypothetical protein